MLLEGAAGLDVVAARAFGGGQCLAIGGIAGSGFRRRRESCGQPKKGNG